MNKRNGELRSQLTRPAMYLKTGHPSFRSSWDIFISNAKHHSFDHHEVIAEISGLPTKEVTRSILRAQNGLPIHPVTTAPPINQLGTLK